jgi:TfoX/Sxy family transcriptional regulator of competence genes
MAYDTELANRIRELLAQQAGSDGIWDEKAMFGGLAFLVRGHMAVAVSRKGGLMVRVPPDETEKLLGRAHVSPMVMAGRETRGWLRVDAEGVKTTRQLRSWVIKGTGYARTLLPK